MKLGLHAVPNNWERFGQRKTNALFKKVRAKVIRENDFSCQFCHFKTPYLDIINIDHDYSHNVMTNFATACVLCARCQFMDAYKLDYDGMDRIIYLPEIDQIQLNKFLRVLFCRIKEGGDSGYNAKMLLAQLQDRATWLDERAGCRLSHPGMFAHYLHSRKRDVTLVSQLKWLPVVDDFENYIEHWRESVDEILEEAS